MIRRIKGNELLLSTLTVTDPLTPSPLSSTRADLLLAFPMTSDDESPSSDSQSDDLRVDSSESEDESEATAVTVPDNLTAQQLRNVSLVMS